MEKTSKKVRIPKQKRSIDKKNRIMAAAKALFERKGFDNTDSKEIAAQAGVSIGTFYCYFEDKKSLLFEIIRVSKPLKVKDIIDRGEHIYNNSKDIRELICYLIRNMLEVKYLPPQMFRRFIAMRYVDPDVEKFIKEQEEITLNSLKSLLMLFKDKIKVTNLDLAARMIFITLKETTLIYKIFKPKIKKNQFIDQLADMICKYLLCL